MLIALYIGAVVIANVLVGMFGPAVSVITAFVFIGLDVTTRDALHERWHGRHLARNMALLIGAGSLLSALLNAQVARVALASCLAFAGAGAADTVVYTMLGGRARFIKINGSNVVSSAVDSVLFPALAFGFPLLWAVMAGQFVAKVAGGFVWSLVLARREAA